MFSEVVKNIVSRCGRADRLNDIISYVNATIRECQSMQLFDNDLVEDQLDPTASPFIWPKPRLFRVMQTVKYSQTGYMDIYPKFIRPGRAQERLKDIGDNFYYAASTYFVFSGVKLIGAGNAVSQHIDVAYYTYFSRLNYYSDKDANNMRPAIYNEELGTWIYWNGVSYVDTLGTDDLNQAAQDKVANWLLIKYRDVIEEGALAKILKIAGDNRAVSSFALYKSYQNTMLANESYTSLQQ